MWKWLGGCLLVCVAVIGFGLWSGYRQLSKFGSSNGTETVTIGAPVARVFASLANSDSLSTWMAQHSEMRTAHHGMLVPGDTLIGEMRLRFNVGNRPVKWTVADVKPNQLLALQLRTDSGSRLIAKREFTLAARGDSTVVMSAVTAPMLDSLGARRNDTLKESDAARSLASKVLTSALRMQSHVELEQLKARVEGHRTLPVRKVP